jgi:hypothetical protein
MVSVGAAEIARLGAVRSLKPELVFGTGMQPRSEDVPCPPDFRTAHSSINGTGEIDRGEGFEEASGIWDEAAVVRVRSTASKCPTGAHLLVEDADVRSLLGSAPPKPRNWTIRRFFDRVGIEFAKGSVWVDGDGDGVGGVGD